MPFYLRKAKKFGPLRVNLSKSGVGASLGVKGARVATGPRGTIINMGRGGAYYRKSLGPVTRGQGSTPVAPEIDLLSQQEPSAIDTADVDELIDSSSDELIAELNGPRGNWLKRVLGLAPPVVLHYDLDTKASETFEDIQRAVQALSGAHAVWLVEAMSLNVTADQQKHNAGAGRSLTRRPIRLGRLIPPKITTNVEIFGIDIGAQQLLFFPDRLLIHQRRKYASVAYPEITLKGKPIRFVEDGTVPSDAEVIDHTWQYVNKAGGPDRRFNNNRQLPVLSYEAITLTSDGGINLELQVSNRAAAEQCCSLISSAIQQIREAGDERNPTLARPKSDAAVSILSERPVGWEYLYFSQLLTDEIDASGALQPPGSVRPEESIIVAADEFPTWLSAQIATLRGTFDHTERLLNEVLPVAFGPKGSSGDQAKIESVASQLGDAYRASLKWPLTCQSVRTDSRWSGALREIPLFTSTTCDEFEEFAARLASELPDTLRRGQAGETVALEVALHLTAPDMAPSEREMENARRAFEG